MKNSMINLLVLSLTASLAQATCPDPRNNIENSPVSSTQSTPDTADGPGRHYYLKTVLARNRSQEDTSRLIGLYAIPHHVQAGLSEVAFTREKNESALHGFLFPSQVPLTGGKTANFQLFDVRDDIKFAAFIDPEAYKNKPEVPQPVMLRAGKGGNFAGSMAGLTGWESSETHGLEWVNGSTSTQSSPASWYVCDWAGMPKLYAVKDIKTLPSGCADVWLMPEYA